MVYIILFLFLIGCFWAFDRYYEKHLNRKEYYIDMVVKTMKKIFHKSIKVTYHGAQGDHSMFFVIEKEGKDQEVLHMYLDKRTDKIEFYEIDLDYFYSKDKIMRLEGEMIIQVDIADIQLNDNVVLSTIRRFIPDQNMKFNRIKNKKILFDNLYGGLVEMRRISKGSANTVKVEHSKFIQNIFT